jgi:hypothetical protein
MKARLPSSLPANDSARSRSIQRLIRTYNHPWKYKPAAVVTTMMK